AGERLSTRRGVQVAGCVGVERLEDVRCVIAGCRVVIKGVSAIGCVFGTGCGARKRFKTGGRIPSARRVVKERAISNGRVVETGCVESERTYPNPHIRGTGRRTI